ncbi:hypothetical protein ACEN2I_06285 [Flavobacterium sp. W22_SRS_FK3]|uniref:hypothetical protein n=1 Tax=Flavobacterium sp. W22_SRS_FK3 TaxID=3240275 RepID=UPI003F8EF36E
MKNKILYKIDYLYKEILRVLFLEAVSCCPLYLLCRTQAQKDAASIRAMGFKFHEDYIFLKQTKNYAQKCEPFKIQ